MDLYNFSLKKIQKTETKTSGADCFLRHYLTQFSFLHLLKPLLKKANNLKNDDPTSLNYIMKSSNETLACG